MLEHVPSKSLRCSHSGTWADLVLGVLFAFANGEGHRVPACTIARATSQLHSDSVVGERICVSLNSAPSCDVLVEVLEEVSDANELRQRFFEASQCLGVVR